MHFLELTAVLLLMKCSITAAFSYNPYCYFHECCTELSYWMPMNYTGLQKNVEENLYGQYRSKRSVLGHIKKYFKKDGNRKGNLLVFSGPAGTGKSFVADLIAKHMFIEHPKSKFVRYFNPQIDFVDNKPVEEYKAWLKDVIMKGIKGCPNSIFIFDECENMRPNILDVIKPFVDRRYQQDNVFSGKSLFIIMSNTGYTDMKAILEVMYAKNATRESFYGHFRKDLESSLLNKSGQCLHNSNLLKHGLVTSIIPFLPLEKEHVRMCIKRELNNNGIFHGHEIWEISGRIIQKMRIIDNVSGFEYFEFGCKQVEDMVTEEIHVQHNEL